MFNDEFVSSCGHTFDIEKMRQFWNVTLRRIKDYAEAAERNAGDRAEKQSNARKSWKQQN
jgi:hypothetical protein